MAESGDRQVWHLPKRPGSAGTMGTASEQSLDRAWRRATPPRPAARPRPCSSPRPSPRLPAQPLPPLPTRLPQVSTNGNGSHSAGDQRKQNTEAAAGGPRRGKAPEPGRPRGPALPTSPRPHSPAPESAPWPSPALQSRLETAAARAPGIAPLRVSRAAPASSSVRPRGPSRGIGAKEPQPLSRLPGTPGPGTTTPSRLRDTNARDNGVSRGTNASSRFVLRAHFPPTLYPPPQLQGSGR